MHLARRRRAVRYGGDEFCLLLPDTALDDALLAAERVRASVADRPFFNEHADLPVTVSIGAACADAATAIQAAELLERADQQLYTAKRAGRTGSLADVRLPRSPRSTISRPRRRRTRVSPRRARISAARQCRDAARPRYAARRDRSPNRTRRAPSFRRRCANLDIGCASLARRGPAGSPRRELRLSTIGSPGLGAAGVGCALLCSFQRASRTTARSLRFWPKITSCGLGPSPLSIGSRSRPSITRSWVPARPRRPARWQTDRPRSPAGR